MSALRLTPTVFEGYRMVSSLPRSMFSRWTSNPSGARISSCCAMPFDPTMKKIENMSNPFFMICPGIGKLVLTDLCKIWIIVKMTQTSCHFYTIIFQGDQYILEFALVRATNPRKSALYRVLPHAQPGQTGFSCHQTGKTLTSMTAMTRKPGRLLKREG